LAATKTAMGEKVVEFARSLTHQMGEDLPLFLALEIRARRRSGQIELWRIARMLGH